ncbi:MAG TPA: glycoside hydrolase family 66 protein [Terracidiphilus sp.]|nr:glycoside hydrolase family 66 protein [Terracidiphilus sp.]
MTLRCCIVLTLFSLIFCASASGQQNAEGANIADVYTDKARYAPNENVTILIQLKNDAQLKGDRSNAGKAALKVTFWHLGERVGEELSQAVDLSDGKSSVSINWTPPDSDFRGYLVGVRLVSSSGETLGTGYTAVDVSSQWNRFPRYGYLAHYSKAEGAMPAEWIAELNKFHIDGLEYYDFENRHEQPLAGTVEHPDPEWKDIAGRRVERSIVDGFLAEAHRYHMMSMAYNTSYCAYADAFTNGSGVKLRWATWPKADGPRTLETAMALNLDGDDQWKTHRLVYMNQNLPDWQNYLFRKMAELFRVYPFDGWQVDTFGTTGGYSYEGSYVNFILGFRPFVDNAHAFLKKDIVLNTVNTWGQDDVARSAAAFVHSELWEDHETYSSIAAAAEQVHTANPAKAVVFAAYLQRQQKGNPVPKTNYFNPPSVLLADATIFASGAAHIELGDGSRMLSSEYFPADTRFAVSPDLSRQLRHYYDFLTAYENVLSYQVAVAPATVRVAGQTSSANGVPNTIWTLARQKDGRTIIHLINLLGSSDAHWRDVHADRPDAPLLKQLRVRIAADEDITRAGWASPDVDGGMFHPLAMTQGNDNGERYVELVLPSLKYWDMIVLHDRTASRAD